MVSTTARTSSFNGWRSIPRTARPTSFFTTGGETRRIEGRLLYWRAPPMAESAFRITGGPPIPSKREGFSSATTRGSPHGAGGFMVFGPSNQPRPLKRKKMPMRRKPRRVVRWSKLASRISLQAQAEVPDKLHLSLVLESSLHRERGQGRLSSHLSIDHAPDSQGISILQFLGQRLVGKSLVADRPGKPENRPSSNRSGSTIRGRRIRASVNHSVTDLDSGGKPVKDKPSDLVLKDRDELSEITGILCRAMNRSREMAFESAGNLKDLIPARVLYEQRGRAKDLRLQV